MPSSTINELLAEFNDPPLTEAEYRGRRAQLLLKFHEQHNLSTWSEIEKAIRTQAIDESMLVEEWIELRAFEPLMSKRPPKRRDDTNQPHAGRESGPFLFGALRRCLRCVYTRRRADGG